jgi:manganese transport protein
VAAALGGLLAYLVAEPFIGRGKRIAAADGSGVHGEAGVPELEPAPPFRKVGAALDFGPTDGEVLSRAAAMASGSGGRLVLVHVVESAASRALGSDAVDRESVEDLDRLQRHAVALGKFDVDAEAVLGYGSPVQALPEIVRAHGIDLLVVGAHGHRGLSDVVHGSTINELRHRLDIAVLVVRAAAPPG